MEAKLKDIITGRTQSHLSPLEKNGAHLLHKDIISDYLKLKKLCELQGHGLEIVSSFRSFSRQLFIWNNKASGKRDILDDQGKILDPKELSPKEIILAIMRWSALPGMSRHHWGTDFDIIDKNKMTDNYQVQLIPQETSEGGIFSEIHKFLDKKIVSNDSFNFYRPYEKDLGGVAPEKWHLSHGPVSQELLKELSFEFFANFLEEQNPNEFLLLNSIKDMKEEIYERFIINLSPQPL